MSIHPFDLLLQFFGSVVGVQGVLLLLTGIGREWQGWLVFLGLVLLIIDIDLLYKGGVESRHHRGYDSLDSGAKRMKATSVNRR